MNANMKLVGAVLRKDLRLFWPLALLTALLRALMSFRKYEIPFTLNDYLLAGVAGLAATLFALASPDVATPPIVVASVGAAIRKTVPHAAFMKWVRIVEVGDEWSDDALPGAAAFPAVLDDLEVGAWPGRLGAEEHGAS